MRYLVFATDYDGTLALDGKVSESTVVALERVVASGRKAVLVTGRQLPDLQRVFDRLDLFEWVVAENGALLYRPSTREERCLAEGPTPAFIDALHARGVQPSVGRVVVATWVPNDAQVLEVIREMGLDLRVIYNKGAVMILPASVSKATGLAAALDLMGLSPHNVVGIGDAENDHAFLSACERSVAVANALPAVQERVDHVTVGDHGAGVEELVDALLSEDAASIGAGVTRQRLPLGATSDGREAWLPAFGSNVLLAGSPGSGKSTLAKVLLERLSERAYQFCVIDPEGDYEAFEEAIVLGGRGQAPTLDEVDQVLARPSENLVVNLLAVPLEERPRFFPALLATLLKLRSRTGRPHWILVDEVHHFLPEDWATGSPTLPQDLNGLALVTCYPERVAAPAVRLLDTLLVVGDSPGAAVKAFAKALDEQPVATPHALEPGQALIWAPRRGEDSMVFQVARTRLAHRRHQRKYAHGDLGDSSFYFRGPSEKLNLRAQNLMLFCQLGDGVDDETWLYHLRRGDYSNWFHDRIKDEELAEEARSIEKGEDVSPRESRRLIREAVEKRYTLPAEGQAPPRTEAPPPGKI